MGGWKTVYVCIDSFFDAFHLMIIMITIKKKESALNSLFLGDTNRMIAETPMNMVKTSISLHHYLYPISIFYIYIYVYIYILYKLYIYIHMYMYIYIYIYVYDWWAIVFHFIKIKKNPI